MLYISGRACSLHIVAFRVVHLDHEEPPFCFPWRSPKPHEAIPGEAKRQIETGRLRSIARRTIQTIPAQTVTLFMQLLPVGYGCSHWKVVMQHVVTLAFFALPVLQSVHLRLHYI